LAKQLGFDDWGASSFNNTTRMPAPQSIKELQIRAHALQGHTLQNLADALKTTLPSQQSHAKGFVGQLVERVLGSNPKAFDQPDFTDLGIELKTIPIGLRGNPLESTFCCSIKMGSADKETWETSRLKKRLQHVLWVPIEAHPHIPLPARKILKPVLWQPSEQESAWLQHDWEILMGWIGSGNSDTLSAKHGSVLQVRPKAQNASVKKWAPNDEGLMRTLPLGFYLRPRFTAHIIQQSL
jgi:DNA mismatch repair protein MutH